MKFEEVEPLWTRLVENLASLQDHKLIHYEGHVVNGYTRESRRHRSSLAEADGGTVYNPVCGFDTIYDTACTSRVFATQYRRTGVSRWRERATSALDALKHVDIYGGVHEPQWDPIGWHLVERSLYATGVTLDATWGARQLLERDVSSDSERERLYDYLEGCSPSPDRFAHDVVPEGFDPADVQNTTTIGLYLLESAFDPNDGSALPLYSNRERFLQHVLTGQRSDGFWPYIFPGPIQRMLFNFQSLHPILTNPITRSLFIRGDSSIFSGDVAHHCYVMHFLAKVVEQTSLDIPDSTLLNAWTWMENHLVRSGSEVLIDYSWEPGASRIRFCNYYDTTAYFLVPVVLQQLVNLGLVNQSVADEYAAGLLRHIELSLLRPAGENPCVQIHECEFDERWKILPAVWGSVSWKGSLLAQFVDLRFQE